MATTSYEELEQSIDINATPAQVWALVTDIPRMAQWSPQVKRSKVKGGVVEKGATFSNLNGKGFLRWPTNGKVVRFEPHRDFAFRIKENKTIWSFELAENATGGTTVTQRRELPDGISALSTTLTKYVLGGVPGFTQELKDGMSQTLQRMKAELESA
ncbi:MAG: SRPBCC family protein [Nocardioides sp.]